ncbi:MAG: periplasmic heavy metal sensor [Proteobacteria bacterium]|nr:periplasmic heavy metal sensor [Pseudomonadota bacterium]
MTRLKFWLFSLSIALNVFFVGVYMANRLPGSADGGAGSAHIMPYETLGLSAGQRAVFEAERDRFHGRMTQTRQAIRSSQDELIHLLSAGTPDRAAINARQQEILSLQGKLQQDVISHLLDVSAPLVQEQRAHFFALLRERMAQHAPLSPPICY